MHYPRTAFSANGQDTIVPVDPNAQIGQRTGLSPGDIAAVRQMYPTCHVKHPATEPAKPLRDPIKPVRDPGRFKKLLDDERIFKLLRDPVKPLRDPGPIKIGGRDLPPEIGSPITNPVTGTLRPFGIATPHHAPGLAESDEAAIDSAMQRQLLELDAAISRAQATIAESSLDLDKLLELRQGIADSYQGES